MKNTSPTRRLVVGGFALAALLAASCSKETTKKPDEAVPVTTAAVVQRDIPIQLGAIGTVEPLRTVAIKAQVGGQLMRVFFREGQDVRAGEPLFQIDPRPYHAALAQAEAALQRDLAQAKNAEADAARYAQLVQKDYVTREAYDHNVSAAESARAVVVSDRAAIDSAQLLLSYCLIRSPLNGRTGSLMVHEGNLVKANDVALVTINQITPVYAAFSVPEEYLPKIRTNDGQTAEATSPSTGEALGTGSLTFLENAVDPSTGTITLKASFENTNRRLWPGEFVNINLTLGTRSNAILVPSSAVQTGQRGQYVYVVKKDGSVENRPVTVASTFNQDSIVEKGLTPGEEVVTDGQLRLTPKSRVAVKASVSGEVAGR